LLRSGQQRGRDGNGNGASGADSVHHDYLLLADTGFARAACMRGRNESSQARRTWCSRRHSKQTFQRSLPDAGKHG
jgi:hypothetical protein